MRRRYTLELDEEDDYDDETDVPAEARVAPAGFTFAVSPPLADALVFSKEQVSEAAEALVGRSILFNWPVIGWHAGVLQWRVADGRIKRNGEACNFYVFYDVDDDEVPTALRLEDYGGEDDDEHGSWVLLESTAGGEAEGDAPAAAPDPEAAGSV